jgi:nucleoid DNA-binding protein
MTQTQLVQALAEKCEVTKKVSQGLLAHLSETAIREVEKNGVFVLPGIGDWSAWIARPARDVTGHRRSHQDRRQEGGEVSDSEGRERSHRIAEEGEGLGEHRNPCAAHYPPSRVQERVKRADLSVCGDHHIQTGNRRWGAGPPKAPCHPPNSVVFTTSAAAWVERLLTDPWLQMARANIYGAADLGGLAGGCYPLHEAHQGHPRGHFRLIAAFLRNALVP